MPMPHRTYKQVIRRRLVGKEGSERTRELRVILTELPNYKNGPYADLRKWVQGQLEETRTRSRVIHRDSISVQREGAAQIAFVGPPNAGKSSLLQALSQIQIKTGDYAFTTTRPVPALTRLRGVLVQLVEIPGLIEGAREGRGGGRAFLGVLRNADAVVLCQDSSAPPDALLAIRAELERASISLPSIVAATKADEAEPQTVACLREAFADVEIVPVSVLDDDSLATFAEAVWQLSGLVRVFVRRRGDAERNPVALRPPATVVDVAATIHHELARDLRGARVWGSSARFEGQRVGARHELAEGDVVEILT
jgi:uncharacterized protein